VFGAVALQIAETGVLPHTFGVLRQEIDMFKAGKFKMDVD
jgi:hypothetical protein